MKVIITGMHRSGTSMVAGLLNSCGLYLGKRLLGKSPSNARGHFEDTRFLALNDELLKRNGGRWDKPPKKVELTHPPMLATMIRFVRGWPKQRLVGWKDPRACLTLPFWRKAIAPEELKVVLVSRSFDDIAASLHARNGMDKERGRQLAFIYTNSAMKALEGMEWKPTEYSEYFKNPLDELKKLIDFLGLQLPEDTTQIENFIDFDLWHHRSEA